LTLFDLLAIRRRERPGAPALAGEGPGELLTYAELWARLERAAAGLASRGLGRGDRVVFLAGNRLELAVALLAALRLGALAVPVNLAYRPRELAHLLADSEPRLLVTEAEGADALHEVPPESRASVEAVVTLDELGRDLRNAAAPASLPAPPDGGDPAFLVYTSGTTGASKGAVLTHDNLLATVTGLLAAWAWRPDDVLLLTLPLFHVHGLVVGFLTALAAGARVELRRRFDAEAVAAELTAPDGDSRDPGRADGPTLFFGVPTMYVRLLDALGRAEDRSGLRRMRLFASGSAPLAPETFHAFREATGHEILERYGMSETGMNLSNPYAGPRRPGTVGVPLPGVSIRIVDPESAPPCTDAGPGEAGELLVSGPNVFAGYWRAPEKTAASFVPGADGRRWFRTGDLARRDPETGHVTLLGRRHELLIRGGLNVYPREVEEVLERFAGVAEAAVAARPDPEWGEVPVAWLVADTPDALDLEALLVHCRHELAPFKVPAEFHLVAGLPRNALGKLQKHLLEP